MGKEIPLGKRVSTAITGAAEVEGIASHFCVEKRDAEVGHPWAGSVSQKVSPRERGQKKNRSLAGKLEAAEETWAVLGFFAVLRMTLSKIHTPQARTYEVKR